MDAQATFSCSFTQSDLSPVAELPSLPRWPAQRLLPQERQDLAVQVLAGAQPVSDLAREHEVSRKFLYQQAHTAQDALTQAFDPESEDRGCPLPPACDQDLVAATGLGSGVDRPQPHTGLSSNCSATSSTGPSPWVRCTTSSPAPLNRLGRSAAVATLAACASVPTTKSSRPVTRCSWASTRRSTYCYLLSLEEHRDADTWGVRLLDLVDQGFNPEATVADAGSSLRAGQAQALPNVPCQGDIFHIVRDLETVVSFLENRAYDALETSEQCERRRDRLRRPTKRRRDKSAHGRGAAPASSPCRQR